MSLEKRAEMPVETIQIELPDPMFDIEETFLPEIADLKEGQTINGIINYKVIEKTKRFAVLRIEHLMLNNTKRLL